MPHPSILQASQTALVIVDVQEAFRRAIPELDRVISNIARAAHGFRIFDLPVVVTEQYPQGLGRTVEEIISVLPPDARAIEKSCFSACGATDFTDRLRGLSVEQVVLCGIEAHVCVSQTAHDLLGLGVAVHILEDCIASRTRSNRRTGLRKMRASGCLPSSVEMALFELMRDSKHDKFKAIQALVK
jgi:nicotinamidase-related amidase